MVSAPEPAGHSPMATPEGLLVLAEVTASRRLQIASSATSLDVLFTLMVAAESPDDRINPVKNALAATVR